MVGPGRCLSGKLVAVAIVVGSVASAGVTSRTEAAAASTYSFGFEGATGAPGYPWLITNAAPDSRACTGFMQGSCPARNNVFRDGEGHLVLRVRRQGTRYRGAIAGTFIYTGSWPPASKTIGWRPPFTVKLRAKMPSSPGLWSSAWYQSVNQPRARGLFELDQVEQRTSVPFRHNTFVHFHKNGAVVDALDWDCFMDLSTAVSTYHVYTMVVASASVVFRVDNRLCGTYTNLAVPAGSAAFSQHTFGVLLQNVVGAPGSWASGGRQPTGSGPWDMVIDWLGITQG